MTTRIMPHGMKVGAVSLWLLLLLSEKPMYGYELIRELEKRFSGYWRPKTGTIYPALEKLEQNKLVTSRIEFREEAPDRKHYALTEKGQAELATTMTYWTKMTEILENYRETHQSIFRQKSELRKQELSQFFTRLGTALGGKSVSLKELFPNSQQKTVNLAPTDPVTLKFLYAKEDHKLEVHLEFEWQPTPRNKPAQKPGKIG
jgi:PadR family transcriptional regulator, regulatory protein PadR